MEQKHRKLHLIGTAVAAVLVLFIILGENVPVSSQNTNKLFLPVALKMKPSNPIHDGVATYYTPTNLGACMFGPPPADMLVAAMNGEDWNNAAYCGAYLHVTSAKGEVTVRIVDRCPECKTGALDMSKQAYAHLEDLRDGLVSIKWQVVSPAIPGPIAYQFKDGSSQYWTAVQVRNHRNPILMLEFLDSNGDWINLRRTYYNYFIQEHGMGLGPYTFRVTDWYGNQLTDKGIPFIEDGTVNGSKQFPPGP